MDTAQNDDRLALNELVYQLDHQRVQVIDGKGRVHSGKLIVSEVFSYFKDNRPRAEFIERLAVATGLFGSIDFWFEPAQVKEVRGQTIILNPETT